MSRDSQRPGRVLGGIVLVYHHPRRRLGLCDFRGHARSAGDASGGGYALGAFAGNGDCGGGRGRAGGAQSDDPQRADGCGGAVFALAGCVHAQGPRNPPVRAGAGV